MQTQTMFKPLTLPKVKTNQMLYKLSDIEEMSKLSNRKIHRILAENNIKPNYKNLEDGEYYYSRPVAVKAKKEIEKVEYQEFKQRMYQQGYRTSKEMTAELIDKMTFSQIEKYLSILAPPIIRSGLHHERFYRKEIIKELYTYYLNDKQSKPDKRVTNDRYMKDIDKVTTLFRFADKNGFALDKIKYLVQKYQIHPAFIYGQTEFYYKDSCEWLRLQIVSKRIKI